MCQARECPKNPKYSRIKNDDVAFVPALYADVDVAGHIGNNGELAEGYPPEDVALTAIRNMPLPPSVILHSGGGLYPMWFLHEVFEIQSENDRQRVAGILKGWQSLLRSKLGKYKLDPTADLARVLRLPGMTNHKYEAAVHIVHPDTESLDAVPRYSLDDFEPNIDVEPGPPQTKRSDWNGQPADLEKVLASCAFLRHCRDDAKTLPEPAWYSMISNLARTKDGAEIIHEFSNPYPGYTRQETDRKIKQALGKTGPHTCEHIAEITDNQWCEGCAVREKITSPVVLGIPDSSKQKKDLDDNAKQALARLPGILESEKPESLFRDTNIIRALALLSIHDTAEFAATRADIKRAKISVRDLDKALKPEVAKSKAKSKAKTNSESPQSSHSYIESKGCHCHVKRTLDGPIEVQLSNFTARITEEVVRDDGAERRTTCSIEGKLADGRQLPTAEVPAERFGPMNWTTAAWGTRAVVLAGDDCLCCQRRDPCH